MARACFKCDGQGKLHWSSMSHRPGCIFCETCDGCAGTGAIAAALARCPRCHGQGRYHDSAMSHSPGCIFCTDCATCSGKGAVEGAAPTPARGVLGVRAESCAACGASLPREARFCSSCGVPRA